jgi:hypothetical protein
MNNEATLSEEARKEAIEVLEKVKKEHLTVIQACDKGLAILNKKQDKKSIITNNKAMLVWDFEDAPEEYKILSPHGGDETYLAFVPDEVANYIIKNLGLSKEEDSDIEYPEVWLFQSSGYFGCNNVSHHKVEGGWVYIGEH